MVYIHTSINAGLERGRDSLEAGTVAFLPGQKCLCFVAKNCTPGRHLTPLGIMVGDYTILDCIEPGDILEIYEDTD